MTKTIYSNIIMKAMVYFVAGLAKKGNALAPLPIVEYGGNRRPRRQPGRRNLSIDSLDESLILAYNE